MTGEATATVLVTQALPGGVEALEGLEVHGGSSTSPMPRAELLQQAVRAQGIVCMVTDRIDEELLDAATQLRVVSSVSVGYDHIDLDAATAAGVLVCNTPGVLDDATADLAFALLLMAARHCSEAERDLRAGAWRQWSFHQYLGVELSGTTLGLVGYGGIGQAVARRASGFGMRVLHHTRRPTGVEGWTGELDQLLGQADFVSLHVPLTSATYHLIGSRELRAMKETSVLVNTSRGPVVDEAALATALHDGQIFAAGLDVYEDEPRVHAALLDAPRTVLLPHIGSATTRARTAMARLALDSVRTALQGRLPGTALNPRAWSGIRA